MKIIESVEEFDSLISNGKVVVDFFATWCGPCKMLSPIMDAVAENSKDITFIKVDTDEQPDLAKRYGIMSIPCIKVFENGKETKSTVGFIDKSELEDFIK